MQYIDHRNVVQRLLFKTQTQYPLYKGGYIIPQKKKRVGYKDFHLDKRLETLPPKTKRKT